ncbi:hypothetical protein AXW83_25315 [Bosea sp. PAMC 26642]|nr:hypothetical protein AXW83_25315 [Bosea sp. PAMC 26642]
MTDASAPAPSGLSNALAIALAIVLMVPGYFVGGLAVIVYTFLSDIGFGMRSDGSWIPFFDGLMTIIWRVIAPEFIRGVVAAGAAVWLTLLVVKRANRQTVGVATIAIYVTVVGVLALLSIVMKGFNGYLLLSMAALAAGLVVGGLTAMEAK